MSRVAVLVADDHPVYREGIVRAVKERPELELIAEVATGREALMAIAELRPHVAVLDMKLTDLDGSQVLRAINRDELPTKVVFVSAYIDSEIVYAAIGGGARAALAKDCVIYKNNSPPDQP
jgi:two-component system nitrate/nitrite response regulator NarL